MAPWNGPKDLLRLTETSLLRKSQPQTVRRIYTSDDSRRRDCKTSVIKAITKPQPRTFQTAERKKYRLLRLTKL